MKLINLTLLSLIAIVVLSCEAKIDASSEDAYKASIEKMQKEVGPEREAELTEAMMVIALDGTNMMEIAFGGGSPEKVAEDVMAKVDGMTAEQVFQKSEDIKTRVAKEKKEEARKELVELDAKMKRSEAAKADLAKFVVSDAKFYRRRISQYLSMTEAIIKLTVTNGTDQPVRKVLFDATLVSPDRSVPWVHAGFNYGVPGGVEPGETVTWTLSPNVMSDWYNAESRKGADMKVEAVSLEGADGEILYSSTEYGDEEVSRKEEILNEYPDLGTE
jgi:hypothetical protein